ncbi:MAG: hypothetical protein KatS3mg087_1296 [Patescibacteria group bacterium]|nr:MAG: hypothetical protein KatS3mg087_1296 [Patescibacteria group bacterium]
MVDISTPTEEDLGLEESVSNQRIIDIINEHFSEFSVAPRRLYSNYGPYTPDYVPLHIIKKMRRDPAIALGLAVLKSAVLISDSYFLEGPDSETIGFTNAWLKPFISNLSRRLLNAFDFGFQAIEIVFDESLPSVTYQVETSEGIRTRTKTKCVVPRKFVALDPERVTPAISVNTGRFEGIFYNAPIFDLHSQTVAAGHRFVGSKATQEQEIFLPASKLVISIYNSSFENFRGESGLDAAYNSWYYSNIGHLLWMRHMQKLASGVFIGTAPAATKSLKGKKIEPVKDLTKILMMLKTLGVAAVPYEPDPNTKENQWKIELLESRHTGEAYQKFLDYHQRLKTRAVLIPDTLIGSLTDSGSTFSSHESFFDLFLSWVQDLAQQLIITPINEQLIKKVTAYNFNINRHPAPTLKLVPVNPKIKRMLMDIIKAALTQITDIDETNTDRARLVSGRIDFESLFKMAGLPHRSPESIPEVPISASSLKIGSTKPDRGEDTVRDKMGTDEEKSGPRNPVGEREP